MADPHDVDQEGMLRLAVDLARSAGALGASFWSWQEMNGEEYGAVASFPWTGG